MNFPLATGTEEAKAVKRRKPFRKRITRQERTGGDGKEVKERGGEQPLISSYVSPPHVYPTYPQPSLRREDDTKGASHKASTFPTRVRGAQRQYDAQMQEKIAEAEEGKLAHFRLPPLHVLEKVLQEEDQSKSELRSDPFFMLQLWDYILRLYRRGVFSIENASGQYDKYIRGEHDDKEISLKHFYASALLELAKFGLVIYREDVRDAILQQSANAQIALQKLQQEEKVSGQVQEEFERELSPKLIEIENGFVTLKLQEKQRALAELKESYAKLPNVQQQAQKSNFEKHQKVFNREIQFLKLLPVIRVLANESLARELSEAQNALEKLRAEYDGLPDEQKQKEKKEQFTQGEQKLVAKISLLRNPLASKQEQLNVFVNRYAALAELPLEDEDQKELVSIIDDYDKGITDAVEKQRRAAQQALVKLRAEYGGLPEEQKEKQQDVFAQREALLLKNIQFFTMYFVTERKVDDSQAKKINENQATLDKLRTDYNRLEEKAKKAQQETFVQQEAKLIHTIELLTDPHTIVQEQLNFFAIMENEEAQHRIKNLQSVNTQLERLKTSSEEAAANSIRRKLKIAENALQSFIKMKEQKISTERGQLSNDFDAEESQLLANVKSLINPDLKSPNLQDPTLELNKRMILHEQLRLSALSAANGLVMRWAREAHSSSIPRVRDIALAKLAAAVSISISMEIQAEHYSVGDLIQGNIPFQMFEQLVAKLTTDKTATAQTISALSFLLRAVSKMNIINQGRWVTNLRDQTKPLIQGVQNVVKLWMRGVSQPTSAETQRAFLHQIASLDFAELVSLVSFGDISDMINSIKAQPNLVSELLRSLARMSLELEATWTAKLAEEKKGRPVAILIMEGICSVPESRPGYANLYLELIYGLLERPDFSDSYLRSIHNFMRDIVLTPDAKLQMLTKLFADPEKYIKTSAIIKLVISHGILSTAEAKENLNWIIIIAKIINSIYLNRTINAADKKKCILNVFEHFKPLYAFTPIDAVEKDLYDRRLLLDSVRSGSDLKWALERIKAKPEEKKSVTKQPTQPVLVPAVETKLTQTMLNDENYSLITIEGPRGLSSSYVHQQYMRIIPVSSSGASDVKSEPTSRRAISTEDLVQKAEPKYENVETKNKFLEFLGSQEQLKTFAYFYNNDIYPQKYEELEKIRQSLELRLRSSAVVRVESTPTALPAPAPLPAPANGIAAALREARQGIVDQFTPIVNELKPTLADVADRKAFLDFLYAKNANELASFYSDPRSYPHPYGALDSIRSSILRQKTEEEARAKKASSIEEPPSIPLPSTPLPRPPAVHSPALVQPIQQRGGGSLQEIVKKFLKIPRNVLMAVQQAKGERNDFVKALTSVLQVHNSLISEAELSHAVNTAIDELHLWPPPELKEDKRSGESLQLGLHQ